MGGHKTSDQKTRVVYVADMEKPVCKFDATHPETITIEASFPYQASENAPTCTDQCGFGAQQSGDYRACIPGSQTASVKAHNVDVEQTGVYKVTYHTTTGTTATPTTRSPRTSSVRSTSSIPFSPSSASSSPAPRSSPPSPPTTRPTPHTLLPITPASTTPPTRGPAGLPSWPRLPLQTAGWLPPPPPLSVVSLSSPAASAPLPPASPSSFKLTPKP